MEKAVIVENFGHGILRITLNRPKALNSINAGLLSSLVEALRSNSDARVLIVQGAGERSFCAGEDLKQTLTSNTGSPQELEEAFNKLQDITRLTSSAEPVVIAAVQGFAVGGGAEIALAADFVVGGPGAKFRFPEVSLGHAVTGGITLRLPHLVGLLKAKELLLTGRWVESDEALRLGLLTEVADDPKSRAVELASQLASLPATSLAASKTSLERATFSNMETCLVDEVHVANHCFSQHDAEKAFKAFAIRKSRGSSRADKDHRPSLSTINGAWREAVECHPHRVFLRFAGQDITFQEFESIVARLAAGLQTAGICPGDKILVMMQNSVEMVALWLASNRVAGVWVPVNTELKSVTLQRAVKAANPKVIVVDSSLWPELKPLEVISPRSVYINGDTTTPATMANSLSSLMEAEASVSTPIEVAPDTTAAFLYTSGTTGKSKPCVLSHEYFLIQARALIDNCGLRNDDVLYCPFPLFHIDATALTVIPAILLGATAALSVRFSASQFWDEVRTSRATVYNYMGATLALTYKQPSKPNDQDHRVRLAWGVPLPNFAKTYEERFGHLLVTLYGSVEAGVPVFQDRKRPLPAGSCGQVRQGFQVRIAGNMDEALPPNTPGHLLLRSKRPNSFFKGYFNDSASTAAAVSGQWLHTGDLAKVDKEGNVYFVGRIKDVIRRRGENVNASEVEEEFLQHPDVISVAAYGVPSRLGDGTEEDVKVAIQMRRGSHPSEQDLWNWAAKNMARFQVPSVIQFVQNIDQTPTGKIDKGRLSLEGGERFDIRATKL